MGPRTVRLLRLVAVATVIAMVPLAIMLIPMTDLPDTKLRQVALSYNLTTSINESSTTVGIADSDLYGMSQADIVATFDQMQSLGVNTVRVLVPWGDVYKVPPGDPWEAVFPPDWSKVDFIVNLAETRNMSVLGVVNATPYWGGQNGSGCLACFGAAPDPAKFAAFAGEVAARYGAKVSAYEVWNEPNYVLAWAPQIDPVAYTELLKQAYTAIKAANPAATVVAGVLSAVTSFMGITMDARTFVETMYANGAKGFFDALSIHPYQYTTEFSEGEYDPNVNPHEPWKADSPLEQVIAIRQMMIDNGDEALRIWATEYGLPTGGPNAVTPEQQAQFIEDFLTAWAELDYAGPSFIYTTRDRIEGVVTEDGSFGLYYFDLTTLQWVAKSAAQVIKDFIEAHQEPTDPTAPGNPPGPDLGTQIAQALQAFFAQMQAAMQNFVNQMNAFFNSIAQAIAAIFNPGGVLAQSLPPEVQDEVAEGTAMAAMTAEEDVADTGSDLSESEAAKSLAVEVTETEEVAPETVPVEEPTEAEKVTETPQEPTGEITEEPPTEESTEESTETPATEPEEPTDPEEESTEESTDDTTEETTEESTETDTSGPAAKPDNGDASVGTVTNPESREPVRTGLVARPGKVGDDTKDTDDTGDAPTADDATNDADSPGGEAESGEAA